MNKLIKKYLALGVILATFLSTGAAYATLELELTQGVDSAIPLALATFAGQDSIVAKERKVSEVVKNDLKNSGRFRIVNADLGATDNLNFDFWRGQKVENIITGQVKKISSDDYKVSFKLHDVYNHSVILNKEFSVRGSELRHLAHHISDLIYQQLTGDRGVFSTKIAYILVQRSSHSGPRYKFEVSDVDGFNPQTLLTSSQPLMSPAWSPDGRNIAYVSFEGNRAAIFSQNVYTGQRSIITKFPGINGAPAWSPDGRKMAVVLTQTGFPKIYVLDLATKSLQRITDERFSDTEPSWAPDGRSIIFTSDRGGSPQIYRVYLDSRRIERVTFQGRYNARSSFTFDGKGIVTLHQDGGSFDIAYLDLASGRVNVLTDSGHDESPSLAPNGKMVVYATNSSGRGVLAEVAVDGRVKLLLPAREGEVQEPAWGPFVK